MCHPVGKLDFLTDLQFRDMLSTSFNGLLILIPGMGRLVGAGPPTAADVAEPPNMNGNGYGGRGEKYKT